MKRQFIFCLALFFLFSMLNADMVILKNASEHIGKVKEINDTSVVFEDEGGKPLEFIKTEVLKVIFHHKKGDSSQTTLDSIGDSVLSQAFKDSSDDSVKYPNAAYVVLSSDVRCEIFPDLTWEMERRVIVRILKERGKDVANRSVEYDPERENAEILHARSITVDGMVFYLDDSSVKKGSVFSNLPQYERYKKIQFAMKKAEIGSILDVKTRITCTKPMDVMNPLLINEVFRSREPFKKKSVSLKVPRNVEMAVYKQNFGPEMVSTIKEDKDSVVYSFERTDSPEVESESFMPMYRKLFPFLAVSVKGDWRKVHDEFARLLAKKNTKRTEVKKKIEEITRGCTSLDQKINRIYEFIVKEIRFVSVDPLSYSFEPKYPDEVLKNGLGNSIDKTYLFYSMLKEIGAEVRYCLIRPRNSGELVREVPCINQINRPLVQLVLNGQSIYVDCLYDTIAFGELIPSLQGTSGIVFDQSLKNKFIDIPLNPVSRDSWKSRILMDVHSDGSMDVREINMTTGMYADYIRGWKDLNEEEIKKKFENIVTGINQKSELIRYKLINHDGLDRVNTGYELDYKIFDYCIKGGDSLLVFKIPAFGNYSASSVGKSPDERQFDISLSNVTQEVNEIEISIDKDFKINYLPSDSKFDKDGLKYSVEFVKKDQKISVKDCYEQHKLEYPKAFYADLKKCLEQKAEVGMQWVVIERK